MQTLRPEAKIPLIPVVDDDHGMRLVMRRVMEQEGYRVVEAANGRASLNAFEQLRPDMVLMDGLMPEMDGFDACAELNRLAGADAPPVLIITSLEDNASVDQAFAVGASDYVTKPIHWAVLRQRVRRLLRAREAETVLRRSEARHRAVVDSAFDAIISATDDGLIRAFNHGAERIFGCAAAEAIGQHYSRFLPQARRGIFRSALHGLRAGSQSWTGRAIEAMGRRADGSEFPIEFVVAAIREEDGLLFTAIVRDITERKAFEQQLEYRASHDPLTNLPNRALFMDRLQHVLNRSKRAPNKLAVLFLDLDHFKVINDSLGHKAGDQLLVTVAERLSDTLRRSDTVARLGGDEFTILLEDLPDVAYAMRVAERIGEILRAPINVEGHEVVVTTSVGIAVSTGGDDRADDLLRNADIAMYEAKHGGKARYQLFEPHMNERACSRLELEGDLRRAVERNELVLHYQPVVELGTGRVVELEALVRWQHPRLGLVPPAEFIPIAEETGLILSLGHWVLEQACRQFAELRAAYPDSEDLVISVNLSGRQFQQPHLSERIAEALCAADLEPRCLKLEITETVMMKDGPAAMTTLNALKQLGVQVAVDDFGTGFSALSSLKRFPVDTLKIDRAFIHNLDDDVENTAIVRAIVAFAKALNLNVTAEGIETLEQAASLREIGVEQGQGYLFSRPVSAEALPHLLQTHDEHALVDQESLPQLVPHGS